MLVVDVVPHHPHCATQYGRVESVCQCAGTNERPPTTGTTPPGRDFLPSLDSCDVAGWQPCAPTMTGPSSCGQRPATAVDTGNGPLVSVVVLPNENSTHVTCHDESTRKTTKAMAIPPALHSLYPQEEVLHSLLLFDGTCTTCIASGANDRTVPGMYIQCSSWQPRPCAIGTAAYCGTSCGGGGQGRRTGFARVRSFGGLACWAWVFLVSLCGVGGVVQAVFTPADSAALKAAVGTCTYGAGCTGGCLGETRDGSCPIFAASNDATGNPYGVIGDWDVSLVTSMYKSKGTLSPSPWPHLSLLCFEYTTT